LCDSLIAWVHTFNLTSTVAQLADLKDGVIISKCLNNIDPEYFNEDWLSKIKTDTNDNWRLKLLNLKKIYEAISDYYSEILNHSLSEFQMPNLNLYVESNNPEELSRLLQLVLGCAVNCDRKSEFIKVIMDMHVDTQHMIMTAIQELMTKDASKINIDEDLNYQLKKTLIELNRVTETKDEIEHKCKALDSQVAILQDEKSVLITEIEMLKEKLQRDDNTALRDDPNKAKKMQLKLDNMQDDLYRLESLKEEYRIKYEAIKSENEALLEKNSELKKSSHETQHLKDELDILRHNRDKVVKLETAIESYKIKLEEMVDLKNQIKLLEESNTKYMESLIQMEEENKKITSLKSQIELYKKQMQELHEKLLIEEMKVKKIEFENKRLEERLSATQHEKESIFNELDKLKETNEELKSMQSLNENSGIDKSSFSSESLSQLNLNIFSEIDLLNLPLEWKEKILRLIHENKNLKAKEVDYTEEKFAVLQNQYEDERQRCSELQIKLVAAQALIIDIESQISDLKARQSVTDAPTPSNSKLNDLIEFKNKLTARNALLEDDNKKNLATIAEMDAKIDSLISEKVQLKEFLGAKEQEIIESNEKFRNYLEKAKIVIKSLDPVNNQSTNNEMHNLRNQLIEKDRKIKQLIKDNEKIKNSHEKEEQLLMSAWHKLVLNLNRRSTDERINSLGNSFLSQQRHLPKRQTTRRSAVQVILLIHQNLNKNERKSFVLIISEIILFIFRYFINTRILLVCFMKILNVLKVTFCAYLINNFILFYLFFSRSFILLYFILKSLFTELFLKKLINCLF